MAKICSNCERDLSTTSAYEVFYVTEETIAEMEGKLDYVKDQPLCRRCMVKLASQWGLSNLDFRFISEQAREDRTREREKWLSSLEELVSWVEKQDLLPDIGGDRPWMGKMPLCSKCATPVPISEAMVLDQGWMRTYLHPDLLIKSTKPQAILEKRAFCPKCFQELQNVIEQIFVANRKPLQWEEGKTHHILENVLRKTREKRR